MGCSTPGFLVFFYLPECPQTRVHWDKDAVQPSHHLSPPSPALNFSQPQGLFQWISSLHFIAKILELYFSISFSNKCSRLIYFRIDWFDLGVQGTLKCLLQHHSWKESILWFSALFMVQLSHLHVTSGKIIALTMDHEGKVMSLLYNILSRVCHSFSSKEQASVFSFHACGYPVQ